MSKTTSHGRIARLFHWGTALVLGYGYVQNGDVTNALASAEAMRIEVLFGALVAALFAGRYFWMRRVGHTRLPVSAPKWEAWASRVAHRAIYVGVAGIVLSGWAIAVVANGDPALLELVSDIHIVIANLTGLLIIVHILAAFWHKIVRKDGVFESMVGRFRPNSSAHPLKPAKAA